MIIKNNKSIYKGWLLFMSVIFCAIFPGFELQAQNHKVTVFDKVEHHFANNNGVKIHYVVLGKGPVLIMLHGFPDFWYTWRNQMETLSKDYKVVAVDLRGYNKSDKPKGVENYKMRVLMKDIIAVIDDLKIDKATIIANDWGGAIGWNLATYYPKRVEKLVACNIPHSNGLIQYLRDNPKTGKYAQDFKKDEAKSALTPENMTNAHKSLTLVDRELYVNAFKNSSIPGMLNYYKANYPKPEKQETKNNTSSVQKTKRIKPPIQKVKCPVLLIHGMLDKALPTAMLNNTWDWIDNEVTIHTIPNKGHFIQQEAPKKVTEIIKKWLSD